MGHVAIERAVAYANERIVYGHPIGRNQGVRLPAGRGLRAAARGIACRPRGGVAIRTAASPAASRPTWASSSPPTPALAGGRPGDADPQQGFGYAAEYDIERVLEGGAADAPRPRCPRRWCSTTSPSTSSACPAATEPRFRLGSREFTPATNVGNLGDTSLLMSAAVCTITSLTASVALAARAGHVDRCPRPPAPPQGAPPGSPLRLTPARARSGWPWRRAQSTSSSTPRWTSSS